MRQPSFAHLLNPAISSASIVSDDVGDTNDDDVHAKERHEGEHASVESILMARRATAAPFGTRRYEYYNSRNGIFWFIDICMIEEMKRVKQRCPKTSPKL